MPNDVIPPVADAAAAAAGSIATSGTPAPVAGADDAAAAAAKATADAAAAAAAADPAAKAKADADAAEKAKADEAAAKEKADADAKPIEYTDFTLPEGVEVDSETLGEAKALFQELKLPQEGAQKAVDFYAAKTAKAVEAAAAASTEHWVKTQADWIKAIKADPEIGGAKLADTTASCARALDRFGDKELRDTLDFTGSGNAPAMVKFLARIGREISEDSVLPGAPHAGQKSAAEVLFPSHNVAKS